MSIVEVNGLNKAYPGFELKDVSFGLEKGRITGFIGRNGAGKTTTIKSMLNLVHPDSGRISFFGMELSENEEKIKQRIGYSAGSVNWYPRKKIREISAAMKAFYPGWNETDYRRYLQLFQLDEEKTPLMLSEGMKVKLNLLLALSHQAEVLILDEPTSSLDAFSRQEILEIFTGLKETGISIFFSTHIISDIEKCADDLIYLSGGRLIASRTKAEFIDTFLLPGETLEDAFLRLEKEAAYA